MTMAWGKKLSIKIEQKQISDHTGSRGHLYIKHNIPEQISPSNPEILIKKRIKIFNHLETEEINTVNEAFLFHFCFCLIYLILLVNDVKLLDFICEDHSTIWKRDT